jgi:hypothetical protein
MAVVSDLNKAWVKIYTVSPKVASPFWFKGRGPVADNLEKKGPSGCITVGTSLQAKRRLSTSEEGICSVELV